MQKLKAASVAATTALTITATAPALALDFAGLNNRNEIVLFSDRSPASIKVIGITGVQGKIIGIDVRPADGKLYALATDSTLYTIDEKTGAATRKAVLSNRLDSIDHVVVDFNPQADRLRVMGSSGQNLRVNVDTGQTIVDGKLSYHSSDRMAGKAFGIYAGAYINSYKGAKQTQLFNVDSANGTYVVQDPPNDGILRTVGPTGLKAGSIVDAIDIYTDSKDEYFGYAVSNAILYRFDVGTGTMKKIGHIGNGQTGIIDIAVLTPSR